MVNPFRYSGPIVREDEKCGVSLVDRTSVCQKALRHIQQGDYVHIIGPHQSGRTTLAIDLIGKIGTMTSSIPVLVSCESLVDACREGFVKTTVSRLRRVMKEYLTEDTDVELHKMLAVPPPKTILDMHDLLVAFGDELQRSTEFSETIIFVDEIEGLPDNLVEDVLRLFRGLFHSYAERRWEAPYRVIILTTRDLSCWDLGESSPYNMSNGISLDPFSPEEVNALLDENHVGKVLRNVEFSDSSKLRIHLETGGHPYLVQRLCHILIERRLGETAPVVLQERDVIEGVMDLFQTRDKNLRNLYSEAPFASEEWQLYGRLAAGQREPFEADNPAVGKLARLGAISNVEHYCQISSRIYERQILRRHFRESFRQTADSLTERERLLLHVWCMQKILLNHEIEQLVLDKIGDLMGDENKAKGEIPAELSGYLDRELKKRKLNLDMKEVRVFTDYYKLKRTRNRKEVILILLKAFLNRSKEITTAQ
jgi:hypothetical protein